MAVFCAKCGRKAMGQEKFCMGCGTPLQRDDPAPMTDSAPDEWGASGGDEWGDSPAYPAPPRKKGGGKKVLIVVGIVVILLAAAVGILKVLDVDLPFFPKKDAGEETQTAGEATPVAGTEEAAASGEAAAAGEASAAGEAAAAAFDPAHGIADSMSLDDISGRLEQDGLTPYHDLDGMLDDTQRMFTGAELYGITPAYVTVEKQEGRTVVGYLFAEEGCSVADAFPGTGIQDMTEAYDRVKAALTDQLGDPDGDNGWDVYWEENGCVYVLNNARSEAFYVSIYIGISSYEDTGAELSDAKGAADTAGTEL